MQPAPIETPEGSVLGPTLLARSQTNYHLQLLQLKLIYCLTIQGISSGSMGQHGDQAIHQLNKALKELYSCCLDNRLTLHLTKSEIMLLSKTSFASGAYSTRFYWGLLC